MNLSEFIGLIIFFVLIAGTLKAWCWCMKKPENCIDWTIERRKIDQPLDFPCRRKKQSREDA